MTLPRIPPVRDRQLQQEVEDYLRRREELADQVRRTIEAGQPSRPNFRDELMTRRARTEQGNASAGE